MPFKVRGSTDAFASRSAADSGGTAARLARWSGMETPMKRLWLVHNAASGSTSAAMTPCNRSW